MVKFPLKEIQSTWTQRPTASSSYPYVEIVLGDVATQCTMQLQLEQVGPASAPRPCHPALCSLFHSLGSFGSGFKIGHLLAGPQEAPCPV